MHLCPIVEQSFWQILLADPQIPGEGKTGESQANKIWASYDGFVTNHFSAGRVPLCTSRACRDRLHRRWLPWRYPFRTRGRWIGEKTQQEPGHTGHEGDTQPHVDLPPQASRGENGEVIAKDEHEGYAEGECPQR